MLHLLCLTGFAPQLHPRYLACLHTANTCNYIAHLFLAEVTKQRNVLQVLKCFELMDSQSQREQRVFVKFSTTLILQTTKPHRPHTVLATEQNTQSKPNVSFRDVILRFPFDVWTIVWLSGLTAQIFFVIRVRGVGLVCVMNLLLEWIKLKWRENVPVVLYMMKSNPQLTGITHSQKSRSQFQGRANNSAPCHCLNKYTPGT